MSCCWFSINMPIYVCTRSFAEIRAAIPHPQSYRRLSEKSRQSRREFPPQPGFGDDHFHRIGGGAVDGVDRGHIFNPSPDVDGIAVRLRVRNAPEASLNSMPNFIRGTVSTNALK